MTFSALTPRERFERLLRRETVDRPAWALWKHLPRHDFKPGYAQAHAEDLGRAGYDLWKITIRSTYPVRDYGIEDRFEGDPLGRPSILNRVIHQARDWRRLEPLDAAKGILGQTAADIRKIAALAPAERPVVATIFSPLTQASRLAGWPLLLRHLEEDPAALRQGLEVLAESTRRLVRALASAPLDGLFYVVQECGIPEIAERPELPAALDLPILESNPYRLNLLHLHGPVHRFDRYCRYPVGILHWDENAAGISLGDGARRFPGIVSGGLDWPVEGWRSPAEARRAMEAALARTRGVPLLFSAGCVIPHDASDAEIQATAPCRDFPLFFIPS